MLIDFMRWNLLNIIRVELILNLYKVYKVSIPSRAPLQSPQGQYAVLSLIITLLAHLSVQFNFSWFQSIYAIYLLIGISVWLHKRVYFYHRSLDPIGVNMTIRQFDAAKSGSNHHPVTNGTLSKADLKHHSSGNNGTAASSSSSTASNNQNGVSHLTGAGSDTNSLQRQRSVVYRDFQSVISKPRYNHREFALSLAHLSQVCKWLANEDLFDEMHFQILATRRDVYNIILRSVMITTSTLLACF